MSALRSQLVEQRVPEHLAARIASLEELHSALDLVEVSRTARVRIGYAARAYFDLGGIGLTWIKEQIESLPADGHWQGVARGTLRENLYALQGQITLQVLRCKGREPAARVDQWLSRHSVSVDALKRWSPICAPVRRRTSRPFQWHCRRSDASRRIDAPDAAGRRIRR